MDQVFPIDRQTLAIKVFSNQIEISQFGKALQTINGITIFPEYIKIDPINIKQNLVQKSSPGLSDLDIENELLNGNYYTNIIDYSFSEIAYAANFLTDKWIKEIWDLFVSDPEKHLFSVSLSLQAIKSQLINLNSEIFKNENDIDEFCDKYEIDVNNLIVPARFSEFEVNLETLGARLTSEIIFFRRKLFTEIFIKKFDNRILQFSKDNSNKINDSNNLIYRSWKENQILELSNLQLFLKSQFIFDDNEQFDLIVNSTNRKGLVIKDDLISETLFWLKDYTIVKKRFERALELYKTNIDSRDCLDNLRLSIELLLKELLNNSKSLENQIAEISKYQESMGISVELRNMFQKILDYYSKYQNNNVKHNDSVNNEFETEFIFGLTMLFVRMLVKPIKNNWL